MYTFTDVTKTCQNGSHTVSALQGVDLVSADAAFALGVVRRAATASGHRSALVKEPQVLLVTHDAALASLAQRLGVMRSGHLSTE